MDQTELVQKLKLLIPARLYSQAFVAGGYAASPEQAADIDLWIVGVTDFDSLEKEIRELNPNMLPPSFDQYSDYSKEWHLAGEIYGIKDLRHKVQILFSKAPTFLSTLGLFDISTHQIGWSLNNPSEVIMASTYTAPFFPPKVVKWDTPFSTLNRYKRIVERYEHFYDGEIMDKLHVLIEASWNNINKAA